MRVPASSEQSLTVADLIAWDVAERVAVRVGSLRDPLAGYVPSGSSAPAAVEADFAELTAVAEIRVSAVTGLHSAAGPARAKVCDRAGWVHANIASFQRLLAPVASKLGAANVPPALRPVSRGAAGLQMGLLLGWMSGRVLGQYDLLLTEEADADDQDIVYFVGPNVVAMERRYGFAPRQFRLWLALHEVTHRMQFTGVPWLRAYFLSLVDDVVSSMETDPRHLVEALRRAVAEIRAGRNPLEESGIAGLVAGSAQRAAIGRVQALMSLLEGHGDVTMDRAGADEIPGAARFGAVLRQRRRKVGGAAKLLRQAVGIESKLRQYEQGERFIAAVEAAGGPELLSRVWQGPQWLPSLDEIGAPATWVDRVRTAVAAD